MKTRFFFLAVILSLSFSSEHEYYLSTTNVRWVPEKKELQFTSRFFLEDIEALMQDRIDPKVQLSPDSSKTDIDVFVANFYCKNIAVVLNGTTQKLTYLGREYQDDLLVVYAEVKTSIEEVETLEINAHFLVDFLANQQNIFHLSSPDKKKSFLLSKKQNALMYKLH